jgi:membrane associated rhomboid family serine protease
MFFPFHDENPIQRTPFVTVAIIVINVFVLIYMISLGGQNRDDRKLRQFIYTNGFIPARIVQLRDPKPMVFDMYRKDPRPIPPVERSIRLPPDRGQIIQSAFTAMFIHAGWLHLIMNMWFFWLFGNNIEDRLGHLLFLLFYLGGGLVATACHALVAQGPASLDPVVGASGAVAVTLGAYAVFYPFTKVKTLIFVIIFFTVVDIPALVVLGLWFAAQIFQGVQQFDQGIGANVAWWAHIGGFLVGAALMPLLAAATPGHASDWSRRAAMVRLDDDGFR